MRANRTSVPTVPREGFAVLYARARRARAVAIHDLLAHAIHKLTPRLHFRRWGAHWG